MEKQKCNTASIAVAVLALLLVSSALAVFSNSTNTTVEAADYGDIMQYEWSQLGCDEGQSGFNPGPGPNSPDVLWKAQVSASGFVTVFDGKAFVVGGGFGAPPTLRALDAFTGAPVWSTTCKRAGVGGEGRTGGATKIDDTYLFVPAAGVEVYKIATGQFVSNLTLPETGRQPGGGDYFPGSYSSELKMKYTNTYSATTHKGIIYAINLTIPTQPTIAWSYVCDETSEILAFGEGKLFVGSYQAAVYALDGKNGTLLWRAHKTGMAGQHGFYYNGNFYHAATSQFMSCYDADTGKVLWEYDSSVLGTRSYFAYRGAAGYGRVYDCAMPVDPHGWVVCWDAETGELLWKQPAYYNIAYNTVAVADGKVYTITCDQAAGPRTAGLVMPGYETTCFDAFTGAQLWKISNLQFATPSIAYGNLYGASGGYVYCIGQTTPSSTSAKPWAFGFHGNMDTIRVAVGQSGPSDISHPKWVYETGGEVSGSPAVVDGKVYIGSHDRNWYCLDANTGSKIWNFTVGFRVMSSAAVVGGRVYTGADDGNIYCLDANTGAQIWKTSAGGLISYILFPQEWQPRPSPIVIGDRIYVGALDGKLYCLNTAGTVQWTYQTGGPIGGSPAYSKGAVYIASTDTYLYAIDATTGTLKWKSVSLSLGMTPAHNLEYAFNEMFCAGTPSIGNDVVYIGGGITYAPTAGVVLYSGSIRLAAFNATSGNIIWNATLAGNSQSVFIPTYLNGRLYISEFMQVSCMNATNPDSGPVRVGGYAGTTGPRRLWVQWIGYQILSSVAYADDPGGPKVYVGSDVGSITCLNATDGKPLSAFQAKGNIDSSPAVWEGKVYVGSTDRNVYCFDDSPTVDFSLNAESNKGAVMWNNETITIGGQLLSNPDEITYQNLVYVPIPSDMHPGLPNATIHVSFTKPDMSSVNLTSTTDNTGRFSISYNPNVVGNWGWVAWYEGKQMPAIAYDSAYSEWHPFEVIAPPSSGGTSTPTPTPTPTPGGMPVEYIYAAVAVIAIILIVAAVLLLRKKGK